MSGAAVFFFGQETVQGDAWDVMDTQLDPPASVGENRTYKFIPRDEHDNVIDTQGVPLTWVIQRTSDGVDVDGGEITQATEDTEDLKEFEIAIETTTANDIVQGLEYSVRVTATNNVVAKGPYPVLGAAEVGGSTLILIDGTLELYQHDNHNGVGQPVIAVQSEGVLANDTATLLLYDIHDPSIIYHAITGTVSAANGQLRFNVSIGDTELPISGCPATGICRYAAVRTTSTNEQITESEGSCYVYMRPTVGA